MKTLISAFATLLVISSTAHGADVYLQEQNELWLAQQAAQNVLLSGDCAKTTISRNTKYKIYDRNGDVYISGASYTVKCTEKKPTVISAPANKVSLTWDTPTSRENGTPLSESEISGYFVYHNDVQIRLGKVNKITIPDLKPGKHYFYIQAVDTGGLVSKNSVTVSKDI